MLPCGTPLRTGIGLDNSSPEANSKAGGSAIDDSSKAGSTTESASGSNGRSDSLKRIGVLSA